MALALDEVGGELLEPLWLDCGDRARVKPRRLHELGGDDPAAGLLYPGAGMHPELDAARAGIASFGLLAQTDVAEQSRGEGAVNGAVAFGLARINRRSRPFELVEHARELGVDVAPFAHAGNGKEVLARLLLHLAFEELRQLEIGEEIGALVGEARMALIGRGGLLERPLARILHRERRGNGAHLAHAALVARGDQHAGDARV